VWFAARLEPRAPGGKSARKWLEGMHCVRDSLETYLLLNGHWKRFLVGWRFFAAFFFVLVPAMGGGPASDALDQANPGQPRVSARVPGELIVRFKPGTSETKKAQILKKAPGVTRDVIAQSSRLARAAGKNEPASEQLKVVRVAGNAAAAKAELEKDPNILYVEPNFRTHIEQVVPNDFEFDSLYAMQNTGFGGGKVGADIKATEAWSISTGSRDIVVAVVDTGIDYFHEDLRGNIWTNPREIPGNGIDDDGNGFVDDVHGYDFVSEDSDPFDDHLHGTPVSGTIGAMGNNGIGVVGVCWQVRLMALKAFDEQGNGDVATAVAAIHYAIANGARIINAS